MGLVQNMRRSTFAWCVGFLVLWSDRGYAQPLPDINVYLGQDGNPITQQTIQAAINSAEGTPNQRVILRLSKQTQPITIGSLKSPSGLKISSKINLVIKGGGNLIRTAYQDGTVEGGLTCGISIDRRTNAFEVLNSSKIRIDDFTIQQSPRGKCVGVLIKASSEVTIDKIQHQYGSSMVEIEGDRPSPDHLTSKQVAVLNSTSVNASYGIYVTGGSHIVIRKNHLSKTPTGDCIKIGPIRNINSLTISDNLISECKQDAIDLVIVDSSKYPGVERHIGSLSGLLIERNILADNHLMGLQLKKNYLPKTGKDTRGFSGLVIQNNLILGNQAKGMVVLSSRDLKDRTETGCYQRSWESRADTSVLVQSNLMFANASEKYLSDGCPSSIHIAGSCGVVIQKNTILGGSPKFPDLCFLNGPTTLPFRSGEIKAIDNQLSNTEIASDLRTDQNYEFSNNRRSRGEDFSRELMRLEELFKKEMDPKTTAPYFERARQDVLSRF